MFLSIPSVSGRCPQGSILGFAMAPDASMLFTWLTVEND